MITIVIEIFAIDVDAKALLVLCILAISFYLQFIYNPFLSKTLNTVEQQGLLLNLMTLFLGLTNHIGNNQDFQKFFTIFFLFCTIFFYVYWIYNLWIKNLILDSGYFESNPVIQSFYTVNFRNIKKNQYFNQRFLPEANKKKKEVRINFDKISKKSDK